MSTEPPRDPLVCFFVVHGGDVLLISSFKACDQRTASSASGAPQLSCSSHTLGPRHDLQVQDPSWGHLCAQLAVHLADSLSLHALCSFTGSHTSGSGSFSCLPCSYAPLSLRGSILETSHTSNLVLAVGPVPRGRK